MAVGDAHVFPGFLTPVLTQLSFQSHRLLFSHASAEVRGEKYAEKKVCLNRVWNSQPPGRESDTLTTEPPGRDCFKYTTPVVYGIYFLRHYTTLHLSSDNILDIYAPASKDRGHIGLPLFVRPSVCLSV